MSKITRSPSLWECRCPTYTESQGSIIVMAFLKKGLILLSLSQFGAVTLRAQDLKDELNALEDVPEDDLSETGDALPTEGATPAPPAATTPKVEDPLDALPDSDELPPADDSADSALPKDDYDMSETKGLEKEIDALKEPEPSTATTEALTGVSAEAAGRLTRLDFRQLTDRVRLSVRSDRSLDYNEEPRNRRRQYIIELKNAAIGKSLLKRVLDTGEFDGPVALVQAFDSRIGNIPSVKILIQLRQIVKATVTRSGNDLNIDFPILTDSTLFRSRSQDTVILPETYLSANQRTVFTGNKINLNLKDADIADVVNLLSKASGKNFVLGTPSTAKVTLNVRALPWDQVLSIILLNAKLGYQKLGNVYRIAPITDLKTEIEQAADTQKKSEDMIPLETRLFALSYARAAEVNTNIVDFKTSRGKSVPETRTNSLAVTDTPAALEKIARYIKSIDRQTPQVRIEARIVEARKGWQRTFNFDWKLGESTNGATVFDDSFANMGGRGNTFRQNTGNLSTAHNDVASNTGADGGIRLKVGNLGTWGAVQAVLGMSENENLTKTISSPSVTVLDNRTATITQAETRNIITPGVNGGPPTTTTISVPLSLKVTPQVTTDGFVLMNVDLTADTVTAGSQEPNKRNAVTDLIVQSGKTTVMGGIYQISKAQNERGWPFFRKLPLLGALFQNFQEKQENLVELLMFISPSIVNSDKSLMAGNIDEADNSQNTAAAPKDDLESLPDETL